MVPLVVVDGVGVVVLPVPPLAAVYHFKEVPVAVKADALVFWQQLTGLVTVGAVGKALTVTTMLALGLSQPMVCDT